MTPDAARPELVAKLTNTRRPGHVMSLSKDAGLMEGPCLLLTCWSRFTTSEGQELWLCVQNISVAGGDRKRSDPRCGSVAMLSDSKGMACPSDRTIMHRKEG